MQLGWSDENSSFYIDEHRINNPGWMMKWQWNGGVERRQTRCWENAEHFWSTFSYTSSAMSRICARKTERNLQTFGWCLQFKQSCPWATLSYFCLQNKAGKICNEASRLEKMYQKSSALSICFEMRRIPFANWIHYIAAKKPQPLCETWNERGIGEKGIAATG